jgi:aminomethyltransferase
VSDLKQTPLYDLHRQLGAKMTAFAGYAMPVQYAKGIIHEHLHCRSRAGFFDISHMGQCRVLGANAAAALEKLTPGGILDLAMGRQKYTLLTNPQGGVIDDIIVLLILSSTCLLIVRLKNALNWRCWRCKDRKLRMCCELLIQLLPQNWLLCRYVALK